MNRTFVALATMFALAWLACECVILVGAGLWWPLLAFFVVFLLAIIWLGCMPIEAARVERLGTIFVVVIGLSLLAFAAMSFAGGSPGLGTAKAILALAYGALGLVGTRPAKAAA